MSIKRYIASKDTTITNAYKLNGVTRGVDANMGASDILEIFSIYGQINTGSLEKSRILIQFPIENIVSDRNSKKIGTSGNTQFILKLSNASHSESTPENLSIVVSQVSGSWAEGVGLDMEGYTDYGFANWLSSSNNTQWSNQGGDIINNSDLNIIIPYSTDDLEIDVTNTVESWISGNVQNNGFLIKLSSSQEDSTESYYTKKFFARRSEFFYKRPHIEARTNDSVKDRRNNFFSSSPLLEEQDNLNTIFIYNNTRGTLKNIQSIGTGTLLVRLYSGSLATGPIGSPLILQQNKTAITGGFYSTGIYTASIGITSSLNTVYDVWCDLSGNQLLTGSLIYINQNIFDPLDNSSYILSMPELKNIYSKLENVKMRVYSYNKNWDSNIYTISSKENPVELIENLYYKITRIADNYCVIQSGTGSYNHTLCSYDSISNYFNLDMSIFEPGYSYKIEFINKQNDDFISMEESFKFRVE